MSAVPSVNDTVMLLTGDDVPITHVHGRRPDGTYSVDVQLPEQYGETFAIIGWESGEYDSGWIEVAP